MARTLTMFTWGYWGWGSATAAFVRNADRIEKARGFGPPIFVDVRFSRSVRAAGFQDNAFGDLVGPRRYVWMRSLGNSAIGSTTVPRIVIAKPGAADELLERALDARDDGRRVIFFCSCPGENAGTCHRATVAALVRKSATRRGISLETVEWPGVDASVVELATDATSLDVDKLSGRWPISNKQMPALSALGWGSIVLVGRAPERIAFVSGPARCDGRDQWSIPVLDRLTVPPSRSDAIDVARVYRHKHGLDPHHAELVGDDGAAPPLASACVYTIVHPSVLRDVNAGAGAVTIRRPWTSAKELLMKARSRGEAFAVVFGDATDCSRLIGWATVKSIKIDGDTSRCSFEGLRRWSRPRSQQELVVKSTGKRIARGFIRPYALCATPEFLRGS